MEILQSTESCTRCNFILRLIEACPSTSLGTIQSSWEYSWQLYMVVVTCVPHLLIAVIGVHWIRAKFSYFPTCFIAGIFTVLTNFIFIGSNMQNSEKYIEEAKAQFYLP